MVTKTTRNFHHFSKALVIEYIDNAFTSAPVYPDLEIVEVDTVGGTFTLDEIKEIEQNDSVSSYTLTFTELLDNIIDTDGFVEADIVNIFSVDSSKFTVEY